MKFHFRQLLSAAAITLCALTLPQTNCHAQPTQDVIDNPSTLARLRNYTSARVSSEDREGNADMRRIGPGETLTLADIEGPGEITHIWTTISTPDPHHLQNIVFRIYWDGNEFPSVESPVGDFFGLGMGKYYMFDNPVQAIGTDKGMNCFWPMPFRKGARITATNDSQTTVGAYYYYVDYRKYDTLPDDVAYFHAQYNQATPNESGKNYLIAETSGGRGHFAGVSLSIHTQTPGWWGEGDDIFTIDGEATPSLWGTGSEDYFCGAWCYGETFYNNYFGMPLRERIDQGADNFWNVYRHHLESPITFTKSIKVEIEHGDNGVSNTRKPRNNNYYSCAYYYVDTPRPLTTKLPAAKDRYPSFTPMPSPENAYETQYMKHKSSGGIVESQSISREPNKHGDWLNDDQIFVHRAKVGDTVKFDFTTSQSASGEAALFGTRAKDYARYEVKLDGKVLGIIDGYNPEIDRVRVPLGDLTIDKGNHTMTVTIKGKNPKSTNTFWGIDYIQFGGIENPNEAAVQELKFEK